MRTIDIKIVPPTDPDLHTLIDRLDRELLTLYPADGIFGVDFSDPAVREMTFCVAYVCGTPAGCGGFKPLGEDMAELKRFYVESSFRSKGIASSILNFVEEAAKKSGVKIMRLETGPKQPAAIALYRKYGYRQIACYGPYVGCEHSLCMEKPLA